jgi:hypothetical protein
MPKLLRSGPLKINPGGKPALQSRSVSGGTRRHRTMLFSATILVLMADAYSAGLGWTRSLKTSASEKFTGLFKQNAAKSQSVATPLLHLVISL